MTTSIAMPVWQTETDAPRRWLGELGLLVAAGAFMTLVGAFGTWAAPLSVRAPYWLLVMLGGGTLLAVGEWRLTDSALARRLRLKPDILAAVLTAPLTTALVWLLSMGAFHQQPRPEHLARLLVSVLLVGFALTGLRRMAGPWARPASGERERGQGTASTTGVTALHAALPRRMRLARIETVRADDHYLLVHTDQGCAHIHMRMADALAALAGTSGVRVHRSWWVSTEVIVSARWAHGRGTLALHGGRLVPVSRTYARATRAFFERIDAERPVGNAAGEEGAARS